MSDTMHGRPSQERARTPATAWAPLTDILARGDDLVIRCELPGVAMEDIGISFANGVLTVSGRRHTEAAEDYYVRERFYGNFRRLVSLPEGVGDEDISAAFENGLLVITVSGGVSSAEPKAIRIT